MNKMNEKKYYHKIIRRENCFVAFFIVGNNPYFCSKL